MGIFTAKAARKARNSQNCRCGGSGICIIAGMLVVPSWNHKRQDAEQHQHGAREHEQEELERGIEAAAPRPRPR